MRTSATSPVVATLPHGSKPPAPPPPRPAARPPVPKEDAAPPTRPPAAPAPERRRRRGPFGWLKEAVGAARGAAADLASVLGSGRASRRLHEFADLVGAAREPVQVEAALVRLAGELAGAARVELILDRDEKTNPEPKLVALWPESAAHMTEPEIEALGYPLCLGLWCGAHYQMTLQVFARRRGAWPPRLVRRLTTLCSVAAAAERGLHASHRARLEAPSEPGAVVRDATFLNAVLPYALGQAHRHHEPLSVFCAELDGLTAVARDHGTDAADRAAAKVAEATARTLRGSDVVARLDDNRLIVVLPNTGGADALKVAEVVRHAVAGSCQPAAGRPGLDLSLGVACFPADARDMLGLLAAADDAMNRARARGPNQVATAGVYALRAPEPEPDDDAEAPGSVSRAG